MTPLVVTFRVDVAPAHAFDVWTARCAMWWPPEHTISGDPAAIDFEPYAGGRIVERASGGDEHVWGEVLDWAPPHRLRYTWHLFFDPSEATEVEITFTEDDGATAVRLEQRGWERIAVGAQARRERTTHVWGMLAPRFVLAAESAS